MRHEEAQTADFIAARLTEWGIDVVRNGDGTRSIGLRADMDASIGRLKDSLRRIDEQMSPLDIKDFPTPFSG